MYGDLSKEPVIIIAPDKTTIDGYEFHPKSINIDFWDDKKAIRQVSLTELISKADSLSKEEVLILIDVVKPKLEEAKTANKKVIASGWSGTGLIGYTIERLTHILTKLEVRVQE